MLYEVITSTIIKDVAITPAEVRYKVKNEKAEDLPMVEPQVEYAQISVYVITSYSIHYTKLYESPGFCHFSNFPASVPGSKLSARHDNSRPTHYSGIDRNNFV